MIARHLVIAVAGVLLGATAGVAQTHTELFERAVFAEETAGNLDEAVALYERLLQSPGVPREIAARAQQRLADARRRNAQVQAARDVRLGRRGAEGEEASYRAGQAETASAPATNAPAIPEAVQRLQRLFEQGPTPRPAAAAVARQGDNAAGNLADNYNPGAGVAVLGKITAIEWVHPQTVVYVATEDGTRWGFTTATPNLLLLAGWNRTDPKLGEVIFVHAIAAKGTGACPAPLPNACATLPNGALHGQASLIVRDNTPIFDRAAVEDLSRLPPEEAQRRLQEQRGVLERQTNRPASR